MSIVMVGATSGSITLQEPAVAGTTVLTLPAVSGTVLTTTSPKAGNVIQVVQTVKTDTFTTTSTSFTDVTGLSVSITPTSSSSKILVLCDFAISSASGSAAVAKLLRGSTDIYVGDAASSRPRALTTLEGSGNGQYSTFRSIASYLDSPSTTSSTTYKIQLLSTSGSVVAAINRTASDRDTSLYDARVASSITVMEIAA